MRAFADKTARKSSFCGHMRSVAVSCGQMRSLAGRWRKPFAESKKVSLK